MVPLTNTLEGPYGGTLENRLRFTIEVLSAIRQRVGNEFILGVRYTADEQLKGGINAREGIEISKYLQDSGMVDFLNVIRGHIDTDAGLTDVIPVQGMPGRPIWILRVKSVRQPIYQYSMPHAYRM